MRSAHMIIGLRALSKGGVIPRRLADIKWMSIYVAYTLADSSKRNWKGSSSMIDIRVQTNDKPEVGSSCNHLISYERGLIQQVTGRLTHTRYRLAAVFTDYFLDLIYPHLITFTSIDEAMKGKFSYKICVHHNVVKAKHSRGDTMCYNKAISNSTIEK